MTPEQEQVYQQLHDAYTAEQGLYERVRQLSAQQFELLSNGLQEKAADLVQEKGRLIAEVGEIEKRLKPVRQQWLEIRGELDTETEQPLAELVRELKELIQSILDQDGESEVLLKHLTEETAGRMHQLRQGREATEAYRNQDRPPGAPDPYLFDRKE